MANSTITIATVNKYLKAAGHDERLTRGKDYFYFRDGEAPKWPATAVYVDTLDALSIGDWLKERNELAKAANRAGWC